jgi:hypothetical protein
MNLLKTWFSYRGQLKPFDFVIKGLTPGIILGVVAMRLDSALDARGLVFYPFLVFSVWPASAMLWKLTAARMQSVLVA